MSTIRSVRENLMMFITLENQILESIKSQISKVAREKDADMSSLRLAVRGLIQAGDTECFERLDKILHSAGRKPQYASFARQCAQEDADNRASKAGLIEKWGNPDSIRRNIEDLAGDLKLYTDTIPLIEAEIESFDETTDRIRIHNQAYPKSMIKDGRADNYTGGFRAWMGWVTRMNAGPYSAYLVLKNYKEIYGDYFDDARRIEANKKNLADLQEQVQEKTQSLKDVASIAEKIGSLDKAYHGPENIAANIADSVLKIILEDRKFAAIFAEDMGDAAAKKAAHLSAKISAFNTIIIHLQKMEKFAIHNLDELNNPISVLDKGVAVVPSENVNFDFFEIERVVQTAAAASRDFTALADKACTRVDHYEPVRGTGYQSLCDSLQSLADLPVSDVRYNLDFSHLKRSVLNAVEEYERQQELERQRQEAARLRREAERQRQMETISSSFRRSSTGTGGGSGLGRSSGIGSRSVGGSNNVFGGSSGIGRRR